MVVQKRIDNGIYYYRNVKKFKTILLPGGMSIKLNGPFYKHSYALIQRLYIHPFRLKIITFVGI
jgi:hypothetical protein